MTASPYAQLMLFYERKDFSVRQVKKEIFLENLCLDRHIPF